MFGLLLLFLQIFINVFVWIQKNFSVSYSYRNLRLFTAGRRVNLLLILIQGGYVSFFSLLPDMSLSQNVYWYTL